MPKQNNPFVAVDLFSGAGGMSLGAHLAGINVALAVEKDQYAASSYAFNHPHTKLIVDSIENVTKINVPTRGKTKILFGGPPCQGFSTSNQKTRSRDNQSNWLFQEFIRVAKLWRPDWIVFENVPGIVETEKGLFKNRVIEDLEAAGYTCSSGVLRASDFGVPQNRSRFFIIASRHGVFLDMPKPTSQNQITVRQAFADLPSLPNGASDDYLHYGKVARFEYAKSMRRKQNKCSGHLVTRNAPLIIERYTHISQGGNWEEIPESLMLNYQDRTYAVKRSEGDFNSLTM